MIRIELAQRHDGADMAAATWNGAELTAAHPRSSALRIVARKLRDAGAPDCPWQATRRGAVVLTGPSLARLAARDVRDTDARLASPLWQPFPVRPSGPTADFGEGGRYGGSGELPKAVGGADLGAVSREVGR